MTEYTEMAEITGATELFKNIPKEGQMILFSFDHSFEAILYSMCGCSRSFRSSLNYFDGRY
jgi:hypothetical protein